MGVLPPCSRVSFSRFELCGLKFRGLGCVEAFGYWKFRIRFEGESLECYLKGLKVFNSGSAGFGLLLVLVVVVVLLRSFWSFLLYLFWLHYAVFAGRPILA